MAASAVARPFAPAKMADGLDLVRGCNIIDDLVAKQTQLKGLEAELSFRSDAIAADRAKLESAKAALDADEKAMEQRKFTDYR